MRIVKFSLGLILILGLFAVLGCTAGEPGDEVDTSSEDGITTDGGDALPEGFEMLPGEDFAVANYAGKILVVDIWATWCPPCKKEIPHLIEIANEYKDTDVVLVGISVDDNPMKEVPKYAKKEGINYVNFDGTSDNLKDFVKTPGVPVKLIFDKEGNEVFRYVGGMKKEALIAEIEDVK